MFYNYLKIAWRSFRRHKGYAGINILGLAIGIAACLLILQYVSNELSFENFHVNKDRIYRVQQDRYDNGKLSTQWAAGAFAVGNSFKDAIPEIEDYVKVLKTRQVVAEKSGQPIKINDVFYASGSFFNIFTYPLLHGHSASALSEPFTAAISETTARTLFGKTDVVGRTLELNRQRTYTITAVFPDPPSNTQLRPRILLSYATYLTLVRPQNDPETAWSWDGCLTYVMLRKGASAAAVEAKAKTVVDKAAGEELKKLNASVVYNLQPLTRIHLYSHFMEEPAPNGDGATVYLLAGIAFFIIIIAWINYINLATARALSRAAEVGVRKAIGSQRIQLIAQFLTESALLNGLALLLALLIMLVAIPGFNLLSGQQLSFSLFGKADFWIALVILFLAGVFFSGLYPAFILSRFKPVDVLKGKMKSSTQGSWLRKSLVTFQFAASLFLLMGMVTVYKQMQYMRQQSLGIDISQTLVIPPPIVKVDSTYPEAAKALKEELLKQASVKSITETTSIFGEPIDWNAGGIRLAGSDESTQKQYRVMGVDYDFAQAYGIHLIAGRNFSKDYGTDEQSVLFSRTGAELLGFHNPEEAVGKKIEFWGEQYNIAGITEDFHQQSLHEPYEPLILRLIPASHGYLSLKIQTSQLAQTISVVKQQWNRYFPGNTFEYFFLDDHFNEQYKADQRFGQVFGLFTVLSILVACMGLFGLASFTILQRTKEIGIRKVLGASVAGILRLLYREFAILLLLAFAVATPLAWLSASNWLQGYAFRISIQWLYFVVPFVFLLIIAFVTVSVQSIKAAIANPVKSLRSE